MRDATERRAALAARRDSCARASDERARVVIVMSRRLASSIVARAFVGTVAETMSRGSSTASCAVSSMFHRSMATTRGAKTSPPISSALYFYRHNQRLRDVAVRNVRAYRNAPPAPGYGGVVSQTFADASRRLDHSTTALWMLICTNAGVYYAWNASDDVRWMRKHFTVSEEALHRGRYHTMLTSAFSHFDMTHLGMNMIALYFFGRSVCERFGGRYLLTLYCVGGVGASAAHVFWCRRLRERRMRAYDGRRGTANIFDRIDAYVSRFIEDRASKRGHYFTPAALGASGAVNAIVAFEILLYPMRTIYLYAILPVPSVLLGGLFLLRDVVGIQDGGSGVAHAGHLGGAAVGAMALATLKMRRFR